MKKTGFNGYVYDFSVDYDAVAVDDIKDIQKYYYFTYFNRINVFIEFSKYNPVKLYFNE